MANVITDIKVNPASTTALAGNMPYSGLEWTPTLKPEQVLYIFNISARTFEDEAGRGVIGRVKLRAPGLAPGDPTEVALPDGKIGPGTPDRPYHYVTSFPHPMPMPNPNDMSGAMESKLTDGRRFVVDMISPDNMTLSLDVTIDPARAFSVGNDYAPRGIFFSYSNPPAESDLAKAYARMETYYKGLNQKADTLDLTDKLGLQRAIESNPDHIFAANYFGKPFAFAKRAIRPIECSACGEQKPAGRLFHQTSYGTFCVEPNQEAWKAAVLSGARRKSDVPDELRWFGQNAVPKDE